MPNALTGSEVRNVYGQFLHISGGLTSTRTTVRDGLGVASALLLSSGAASVDNILLDGNTISILDTDGDLTLAANGTGVVNIADVAIVGGTITSLDTPLAVASGGTGGATAGDARTNLGLGSMAEQAAGTVAITGGTVDNLTSLSSTTIESTVSMGFATGAGGTVTQATSKSTGVTLNKACGQITMHNASLNAATSVGFTLTNSEISSAQDVVIVNIASGGTADSYAVTVDAVASGSCRIQVRNVSGGALGEALVLNYAVIRAVAA